jgi:uncharacterized protein (TIGR04255 family)
MKRDQLWGALHATGFGHMIRNELQTSAMPSPSRPADLPDFERPPVNEVVLAVQFASLVNLQSLYVGLFWEKIRKQYPKASEQPPLLPNFETFGVPPMGPRIFPPISIFGPPSQPRYWFESEDGVHLLQVQQDRIVHNWRKREIEQEYPRYESIRGLFETEVGQFAEFLAAEGLGEIRPNQCEVTYVNSIELPGEDNVPRQIGRITPFWGSTPEDGIGLEFENAGVQARFIIRDAGAPIGRVHVQFAPGILMSQNRPIIRLDITVRGRPREESLADALRLIDEERILVVRTFAAVTTQEMWNLWGRKDG